MNVAEFGGSLQRIGLSNLMRLSDIETARLEADRAMRNEESAYKGAAIGSLAGTVVGAGKGYFSNQEADHNAREQTKVNESRDARQTAMLGNIQNGRDVGYNLPNVYQPRGYSVLDDIHSMFIKMGWAD